jgi:ankyrin repeat protein
VLVENGLNVNQIDTYGQNAIYYAVNAGHMEGVKHLAELGSEIDHVDENK